VSSDRFIPLDRRTDQLSAENFAGVLHEGVPAHLVSTCDEFVRRGTVSPARDSRGAPSVEALRRIERELEIPLKWNRAPKETLGWLLHDAESDPQLFLNLVDHVLHHLPSPTAVLDAAELEIGLRQGGSAWMVHALAEVDAQPEYELVRRVDPTVVAAADLAIDSGRPGDHLRTAWTAAYGRTPDPSKAYSEAIKAVEVALGPIVSPNDVTPTLGRMLGNLRGNEDKYLFTLKGSGDSSPVSRGDLDGVQIVRLMAQLLWTGQHDRHGTFDPDAPIAMSEEEGRAAVHLAAVLVQWGADGTLQAQALP
jgi:hypothetical protein